MTSKNLMAQLNSIRVMTGALRENADKLPPGIDLAFIDELDAMKAQIEETDLRQEKLKADLKTMTEGLNELVQQAIAKYAEARKRVKMDFPQNRWIEFGIDDQR